MHFFHLIVLLVLLHILSACSGGSSDTDDIATSITPMPYSKTEPDDTKLLAMAQAYVSGQGAPANTRFEYTRIDLNNDGLREGLILFKAPISHWCGPAGCTLVIFEAQDKSFSYLSTITRVRGPLLVNETYTKGWSDLIVRVSGTNLRDRHVKLSFNGQGYPSTPVNQTQAFPDFAQNQGTMIFP